METSRITHRDLRAVADSYNSLQDLDLMQIVFNAKAKVLINKINKNAYINLPYIKAPKNFLAIFKANQELFLSWLENNKRFMQGDSRKQVNKDLVLKGDSNEIKKLFKVAIFLSCDGLDNIFTQN